MIGVPTVETVNGAISRIGALSDAPLEAVSVLACTDSVAPAPVSETVLPPSATVGAVSSRLASVALEMPVCTDSSEPAARVTLPVSVLKVPGRMSAVPVAGSVTEPPPAPLEVKVAAGLTSVATMSSVSGSSRIVPVAPTSMPPVSA